MTTDVIIVGKGIAGLVLSCLLSQKGIAHVVLGREGNTPDFALAETLPPSAIPLLKKIGLLNLFEHIAIQKTYGYHSLWGSDRVVDHNFYFQSPNAYGLKLNKRTLLAALEEKQAEFIVTYDHQFRLENQGDSFGVFCNRGPNAYQINGRYVIDATGRNRAVLNSLGINSIEYDTLTAYSCHLPRIKHPSLTHSVFAESFEQGWGIVSGLNEMQNVITLFTDKLNLEQSLFKQYTNWPALLSGTRYLKYFLTGDDLVRIKGALANSSRAASISGPNWLALGDAAMAFDPLSSHGITNAIYTASEAAQTLDLHLNYNQPVALRAYGAALSAIFDQYITNKNRLYAQESRWPESIFWRKRNSVEA